MEQWWGGLSRVQRGIVAAIALVTLGMTGGVAGVEHVSAVQDNTRSIELLVKEDSLAATDRDVMLELLRVIDRRTCMEFADSEAELGQCAER